ncbi:MAG: ribosomal protein [Candidatus Peribacteria bacterium]|nr:ribosomal protein [Candidatus Peribacteria bacterium]
MKAHLESVRIAPKKANLIAKLVRGMPVPDAMEALRRTHKKGARIVEELLRSAIANASHNDKQNPQGMVVKTIVVNQGQAYHRGVPKARGQMRPMRKFQSHITITLGFPGDIPMPAPRKAATVKPASTKDVSTKKTPKAASQAAKNKVKTSSSLKKADTAPKNDAKVSADSSSKEKAQEISSDSHS